MTKRTVVKTLSIAAIVIGLLLIGLVMAQKLLGPGVKKLFINEINKSLTARVQLDDVELSLIKDFPYASVRFSNVRMDEAGKQTSGKLLLKAGTIAMRFNIMDLLHKKYRVKQLRLINVELNPRVFADGSDNFHFWKKSNSKDSRDFNFEIQRIIIQNLHLHFQNDKNHNTVRLTLPSFIAKGNFGSNRYQLDLEGNIAINSIKLKGSNYLSERALNLKLVFDADNNTGKYTITSGKIETGKLTLKTAGDIVVNDKNHLINLDISAGGSTLQEMVSLVPAAYTKQLDGYHYNGNGNLHATISGRFDGNNSPDIKARLSVDKGTISEKQSGIALRNVSTVVSYTTTRNGDKQTVEIQNFKAQLGDGYINGWLSMDGLGESSVSCKLNTSLNLFELQQFAKIKALNGLKGVLKTNLTFSGHIADINQISAADLVGSNLNGTGQLVQAEVQLKDYNLPAKNISGDFTFNGNELHFNQLTCILGKSDFNLRGTFSNIFPWIFSKNENVTLDGTLISKRFDWDELSEAVPANDSEYIFGLPADISISNLQVNCGHFTFGKFTARQLSGQVKMLNKVLYASNIEMQSCRGRVSGQFSVNVASNTYSLLQAKARLNQVDLKMLFTQFNNFGQTDLVDENLEGLITADLVFAATMKNNLEIDLNSVKSHADITVEKGRLVNYSPMQSLSSFLKVEDLADIRFATMQNQIDIANQIIYIPSMQISSSALDLQLMGTHTFDNDLDYHFTIALADLLAAKFKKRNLLSNAQAEFGPVEDDGRGKTKVYVSLTGNVDNPVVKYDKKAMREKINSELKSQKEEMKQLIKQEFKVFQGDSLRNVRRAGEKETLKQQEQGKFVIDWDDDPK